MKASEIWQAIADKGEIEGYDYGLCHELVNVIKGQKHISTEQYRERFTLELRRLAEFTGFDADEDTFLFVTRVSPRITSCNTNPEITSVEDATSIRIMIAQLLALEAAEEEK